MTWNTSLPISRKNEILYHNLSLSDKAEYLQHKYVTPQNWPTLFLAYAPNPQEFLNNAFWRLKSDIFLEHYYAGVTDPFIKEPAYALFSLFPSFTSAYFQVKIGASNNNFTFTHFAYTALRAGGKFIPMAFADETKRNTEGALDTDIKLALYITDTTCRWIPYSNERLQSDNTTNVYSLGFYATSVISGIARTKGSEIGSPIAKSAQAILTNLVVNTISTPLDLNVEGTTFTKILTLKNILMGSNPTEDSSMPEATTTSTLIKSNLAFITPILALAYNFGNDYIVPVFTVPYTYASSILFTVVSPIAFVYSKTTELSQSAISYVAPTIQKTVIPYIPKIFLKNENKPITIDEAARKGPIFLAEVILFDIVKLVSTNFASTMVLQPISRVFGIIAEEFSEFALDVTDIVMGPAKPVQNYVGGYETEKYDDL